jgi:1-acyl-sn-glycerol-3-phosphate acyltransferase
VHERLKTDFRLYRAGRWATGAWLRLFYGLEALDPDRVPAAGGAILAANHASFFDIPAVGRPVERFVTFVARDTLTRIPVLGWLIRHWGAILLRRGAADTAALREIVDAVRSGALVAMYPEGTRSADGELQELRAGVLLVGRRCGLPVVPIGIAGTYEIFPRMRRIPRLSGKIVVAYGEPITLSRESDLERLRFAIAGELERAWARWSERTGKPRPFRPPNRPPNPPPNTRPRAGSPESSGAHAGENPVAQS